MVLSLDLPHYFHYFLRRDVTKLYVSIAIRNFALGMVLIYEPIYLYLYFGESLPFTFLFYGAMFGAYGVIAPFAGKLMARLGTARVILLSSIFYFAFYLGLNFLYASPFVLPASLFVIVIGMMLFWPALHTDFSRFSSEGQRGREVGRLNVMSLLPMVISPAIGGVILSFFGYPALFAAVLVTLLASTIPLFYSHEAHEMYTDSYRGSWNRVFKRKNLATTIGFTSNGIEYMSYFVVWPLFMFLIAINFSEMGGIVSLALVFSSIFMIYMGRVSDTADRPWLLNIGTLWTSLAWVLKYFVVTPLDALLAHIIYRTSRAAAGAPFQTFFYEKAAKRGRETDEFIIYREIVINVGRFLYFGLLALAFFLFPQLPLNAVFLLLAVLTLGFMFLGKPPRIRVSRSVL